MFSRRSFIKSGVAAAGSLAISPPGRAQGRIKIHYNEAGSGPALICTHGGGPGANAWDNTKYAFDALAEHFRTILMDLPGLGHGEQQEVHPALRQAPAHRRQPGLIFGRCEGIWAHRLRWRPFTGQRGLCTS